MPSLPLQLHYSVSYLAHLFPVQLKKTQVLTTPLFPPFLGVIHDLSDNIYYFKPYLNCLPSIDLNTRQEGRGIHSFAHWSMWRFWVWLMITLFLILYQYLFTHTNTVKLSTLCFPLSSVFFCIRLKG